MVPSAQGLIFAVYMLKYNCTLAFVYLVFGLTLTIYVYFGIDLVGLLITV